MARSKYELHAVNAFAYMYSQGFEPSRGCKDNWPSLFKWRSCQFRGKSKKKNSLPPLLMYTPVGRTRSLASLSVRGFQLLLSLLTLALGAATILKLNFDNSYAAIGVVVGVFGLIWYSVILAAPALVYITPAIALALEVWLTIWWLISMATTAYAFGLGSCDFSSYYYFDGYYRDYSNNYSTGCKTGKATLAFSVIGFLVSLFTLAIFVAYSIVPIGNTLLLWNSSKYFSLGALFPAGETGAVSTSTNVIAEEEHSAEGETVKEVETHEPLDSVNAGTEVHEPVSDVPVHEKV